MFGGQREEGISLDAVVAQYIKNTDLNQYNTEEPVRIINGLPKVMNNQTLVKKIMIIIIQLMDMMVNNKHQIQTMMTKTILVILMIMMTILKTIMKLILLIKIMSLNS